MKCADCGQPGDIQFTEVVGARKQAVWLCSDCAVARGLLAWEVEPPEATELADTGPELPSEESAPLARRRCERCGTTLVDIRRNGRVGCPGCYDCFREYLEPLLRRVHGALEHTGLAPGDLSEGARGRREIRRLREELRRAVDAEDYEEAARIRDRIRGQEGTRAWGEAGS